MGAMRPNQNYTPNSIVKFRSLEFNQYIGITKFHDYINASTLDVVFELSNRFSSQVKIPYMVIKGPLGSNAGWGDVSLSSTYSLYKSSLHQINFSLGTKIPTNNANYKRGDASLPMYYQSSLGTVDFITGVSFLSKGWLLATGYQQVVLDYNSNNFFWGPWSQFDLLDQAKKYHASKQIQRGNDIMFRVEKNVRFSKYNAYVGLLDVYRLKNDKVQNPKTNIEEEVVDQIGNSKGHALTLLAGFGYNLNVHSSIKFLAGKVLVKRAYNTDGLSREVVISTSYVYKF
jgi:hypothetical protein